MTRRARLLAILGALRGPDGGRRWPPRPAHADQPVSLRTALADENGQVTLGDLFDGAGDAGLRGGRHRARPARAWCWTPAAVQMFARAHGLDWDNPTGIRRLIVQPGAVRSERSDASAITVTAPSTHAIQVLTYARDINTGEIVQPDDLLWSRTAAARARRPARCRRA